MRKKLFITALIAGSLPGMAQLHEQINVEGTYVPEIIEADRLHVLPLSQAFAVEMPALKFDVEAVDTEMENVIYTMPASGWRASKKFQNNRGYLRLEGGSWLDISGSAGWRIVDSEKTLLGLRLQHSSTSLWRASGEDYLKYSRQYRYDEGAGIYLNRIIGSAGRLDASLDYHFGSYNFYGVGVPENSEIKVPDQTLNQFDLSVGWKPMVKARSSAWRYSVGAGLTYYGLSRFSMPIYSEEASSKADRETDIKLFGNVSFPWDNGTSFSLDAKLDILAYGGRKDNLVFYIPESFITHEIERPDDYAMLTLNPAYTIKKGQGSVSLGVDIDLAMNAGKKGNLYSFFHIAPDIKLAWRKSGIGLWLNLTGGSRLNTLQALRQLDYYQTPVVASTRPSYIPLDASLGAEFGWFSGFSVGIGVRYKIMKNVPLGGWYSTWLAMADKPLPGIASRFPEVEALMYCLDTDGMDMHGISLTARLEYKPARWLHIKAEGTWQPQKGKTGFFNGYDRPEITTSLELSSRPVSPLELSVSFESRGNRKIFTSPFREKYDFRPGEKEGPEYVWMKLPPISLLGARGAWSFSSSFTAFVQADNLLDRHTQMLPMQPMQGIVVTAGFDWLF